MNPAKEIENMVTTEDEALLNAKMEEELKDVAMWVSDTYLNGVAQKTAEMSRRVAELIKWSIRNGIKQVGDSWSYVKQYYYSFKKEEKPVEAVEEEKIQVSEKAFKLLHMNPTMVAIVRVAEDSYFQKKMSKEDFQKVEKKVDWIYKEFNRMWRDYCDNHPTKAGVLKRFKYKAKDCNMTEIPLQYVEEFAKIYYTDRLDKYIAEGMPGDDYYSLEPHLSPINPIHGRVGRKFWDVIESRMTFEKIGDLTKKITEMMYRNVKGGLAAEPYYL